MYNNKKLAQNTAAVILSVRALATVFTILALIFALKSTKAETVEFDVVESEKQKGERNIELVRSS